MNAQITLTLALSGLLLACGADSAGTNDPNNGGKTNWLSACEQDAECGSLRCIAKLCTQSCTTEDDCDAMSDGAVCARPGDGDALACLAGCEDEGDCGSGSFCHKATCGEAGECRPDHNAACDEIYAPVCGCDGVTYGNACEAAKASAGVAAQGECAEAGAGATGGYEPCAGKLCGDTCRVCAPNDMACAETEEVKYCDADGRCHGSLEECPDSACAERPADRCEEFGCWAYQGTRTKDAVSAPLGCMGVGEGCDDVLTCSIDPEGECWSSSSCVPAAFERVECTDPRCCAPDECDPAPTDDASTDDASTDDASTDDASTDDDGDGGTDRGCADNGDCAADQYCHIETCGERGECRSAGPCDADFTPVCGCDGVTHSNVCTAQMAGVGVRSQGECPASECGNEPGCCTTDADCSRDLLCVRADCDGTGACLDAALLSCSPDDGPVCGCDAESYANACDAHAVGVSYQGECADDLSQGAQWRSALISFGECLGECEFRLSRNLAAPKQILYEACDSAGLECPRSILVELNSSGLRQLDQAHAALRAGPLEEIYGCPDCADGGATSIRLETSDGTTEHAYEFSNPPPEFAELDVLLLDLHLAAFECEPMQFGSVVGACTPRR